jgi:putative ABC transport system permease protein
VLLIIKSFGHNKLGGLLIVLQIAITLAVACNCLSVIQDDFRQMRRPTGLNELNLFVIGNWWTGKPADLAPRVQADLAAIRSAPGIADAEAANAYPLRGGGPNRGISAKSGQRNPTTSTALYFADERGLDTYGLTLASGRWFNADEIVERSAQEQKLPASVVVTDAVARTLYPSGNALGQPIYWDGGAASRIVGIVERAQTPSAAWSGGARAENSAFLPYRYISNPVTYVVRARPGQIVPAMAAVQERLYSLTRQRVVQGSTFAEIRTNAYFAPRSSDALLAVLCAILLAVTVCGIIGLTMHWVDQRRRYIGMRRALGARRLDILRYFHTENLLIAGVGAALGAGLGLAANVWLISHFALPRMSIGFVLFGAVILLLIGQAAVLWPALRAACVPPAIAARGL